MEENIALRGAGHYGDQSRMSPTSHSTPSESAAPEASKTRACATCARLKMRCRWPASGVASSQESSCIRCDRMKIPCHIPEPTQRKKRGKSTRVAQLEQKIDGLVSMLAAQQHVSPGEAQPLTPESQDQIASSSRQNAFSQQQIQQPPGNTFTQVVGGTSQIGAGIQMPLIANDSAADFQLLPGFGFSRDEVCSFFDVYRRDFMPNFPFVLLREDADPHVLYTESPCLFWMFVAAVAPQPTTVQHGIADWFRRYIAEHMIVKQEKNLALLQAILLHLAWGDFHFYLNTEATNAIQLAVALVLDLKLDRSPDLNHPHPKSLLGEAWATLARGISRPQPHSLDEKRAVLGLFRTTSIISALFKRGSQFPWNPYLGQCCDSLAQSGLESDVYLVSLIRMQRIADSAYCMLPTAESYENGTSVYRAPLDMVINNGRKELEEFTNSQPEFVKRKHIFWANYHVLLMRLSEPAITMAPPSLSEAGILPSEPFQRFETVWKCLLAAGDFFNSLLQVPPHKYPGLPVSTTGLLAFAIVTTSRLLLLDASIDWQPSLARRQLDFAAILKRLGDLFEDADIFARDAGQKRRLLDGGSGTTYSRYSFKVRWIRQWYLSKIPPDQLPVDDSQQVSIETSPAAGLMFQDFNFDDNFWSDFMSMYDPDILLAPAVPEPLV